MQNILFESIQSPSSEYRLMWSSVILMEHYLFGKELILIFCLDFRINMDQYLAVHLTTDSFFFFFQIFVVNTTVVVSHTKLDLLVCQIISFFHFDGFASLIPTPFSFYCWIYIYIYIFFFMWWSGVAFCLCIDIQTE